MARKSSYDAIVVGAGHNGLVCAAYLARAGLRVIVLEARDDIGGMAGTTELSRGVRVPSVAHTVGRLWPRIARDLRLSRHGLALVQPDARVFAPQRDGRSITLWGDPARTAGELATNDLAGEGDAAAYVAADESLRTLGRALWALNARVPPDLTSPLLADAWTALKTQVAARARVHRADAALLRAMPMSVRDLVAEWFPSDPLQAAVAARGVLYTSLGPRAPGTAGVLITDASGNDGGLAGQAVFARGGPGALADALAAAARAAGAEIRTKARVVAVRHDATGAVGVALARGGNVDAPVVVSGIDPRSTLLDLLDPEVLGPRLSWRAGNIRQRGATAKVNYVLGGLPNFGGAPGQDAGRLRGRIVVAPSMRYLERATAPAKYGRLPDEPLLEATIPSLIDPALVTAARARKAARHTMSVVVQSVPYELSSGDWDARRDELGDLVTRTLGEYATGFADLVERREVITPADIEREYGAAGGHAMHAEVALDQWFAWRPLHGLGRYRMPLDGLYLCGSGAHPGGGVTGGPGYLAASAVLDDRARRRRRVSA